MTLDSGIVCGKCDLLNPLEKTSCSSCGNDLSFKQDNNSVASDKTTKDLRSVSQTVEKDEDMEQARHLVCTDCYSPIPAGHKFCGKCGKPVEGNDPKDPDFFGELQTPGKAKLILVKGEGVDGMSYHLNSTEHLAGRSQGEILFGEDHWLSPAHATFLYNDEGNLVIRDESSLNGVFIGLSEPLQISPGTVFMAGEQIFRVEEMASVDPNPESDGTYFFSSPFTGSNFRIVQVLEGGGDGMVVNPKENEVIIGREDADMNFPSDPFISGNHVKIETTANGLVMTDLASKNGTFVKINKERVLNHGDYLFLGRQLLRVEITN
ncbi:MAG: FHA domain-containing protein [Deltaproteobacteria bacterium]|nr:FHA domain-containing protein [Deltaproteobacteria bacterium]